MMTIEQQVWLQAYCAAIVAGHRDRANRWALAAVDDFRGHFPVPPLDPLAPDAEMEAIAGVTEEQLEAGVARIAEVTGWDKGRNHE